MDDYDLLIEKLKRHDEQAFASVYDQTKHVVYAVIMSILKDRRLAEDVMQDAYMKMLASLHTYKGGSQFKYWLYSIARNQALDVYRKRSKELRVDAEEHPNFFVAPSDDPLMRLRVEALLKSLDEEERLIVILKALEEMKFKDIAKVVDKPLGTVLWLYQRALKKMKNSEEEVSHE